jgi:uncharacterized protein YjhX (UPF0386 family)
MDRHRFARLSALLAVAVASASACDRTERLLEPENGALAALQARGGQVTHRFDALADGGRIELQRDVDDPVAVGRIRHHLRKTADALATGDATLAAFAHMREIPGMAVMVARKDRIEYVYRDLPRGGELRLVTNDSDAIRAIHEFVAFHREHHRGAGTDHGARDHSVMHHGDHAQEGNAP